MMKPEIVNLITIAAVGALAFSVGGLAGVLAAWLHYRARERLRDRLSQARPGLWRDGRTR